MSTIKQIESNRLNAQHSTGPKSDAGRSAASLNRLSHGLAGAFRVLPGEDPDEYASLLNAFRDEHQPATVTEETLVEELAQHRWLTQRALRLQDAAFDETTGEPDAAKLGLFLRYQTTHQRAFHRALKELSQLRAEKRRAKIDESLLASRAAAVRIGFESQKSKIAQEQRREELHQARMAAAQAKADEASVGTASYKDDVTKAEELIAYLEARELAAKMPG